ncbi:hypothetical protein BJ508DRAFT_362631 [Ascobolus immersus RN42]|uniref:Wax synthase domain-containing protein n=1 Tax=Ascobolus immersus RN42 TaxID=1160509 RepID=A0A3N4I6Y3_ASCIM|nr:hypothetical protein BJ508DRAFT_362631 [Ascobolus immersus RN42]
MTALQSILSLFEWDAPLSRNINLPRLPPQILHPVSMPIYFLLQSYSFFLLVALIPPSSTRDRTLLALYTAFAIHFITSSDIPIRFESAGFALPLTIVTSYLHFAELFLYGCSPEDHHGYWYKDPKKPKPRDMTRLQKLRWMMDYFTSFRGIGMNWEVKGLPAARVYRNRLHFCIDQIARAGAYTLVSLVAQGLYLVIVDGEQVYGTPMPNRVTGGLIILVITVTTMLQMQYAAALVTVVLGIYSEDSWRPVMGKWGDLYSVRRLWARVWHQNMRAIGSRPADHLIAQLGIKRKSAEGRAIARAMAFGITALTHGAGCFTFNASDGGWIGYFAMQWLMTEVEEGLSEVYDWCVGRRGKDRERPREWWEKLFGFVWTMTWFAFMNLQVIEGAVKIGDKGFQSRTFVPLWESILGMKMMKRE